MRECAPGFTEPAPGQWSAPVPTCAAGSAAQLPASIAAATAISMGGIGFAHLRGQQHQQQQQVVQQQAQQMVQQQAQQQQQQQQLGGRFDNAEAMTNVSATEA